jgi:hypothetical protein
MYDIDTYPSSWSAIISIYTNNYARVLQVADHSHAAQEVIKLDGPLDSEQWVRYYE